ncbi:hypothetical protein [Streptomyces sp. NPDC002671]
MTERAALHEIARTLGAGTSPRWASLITGGTRQGAQATALVKQFDAASLGQDPRRGGATRPAETGQQNPRPLTWGFSWSG